MVLLPISNACADFNNIIQGYLFANNYEISENTIFAENAFVFVNTLEIVKSISVINNGTINGDINVLSGHRLLLQNKGDINGSFYLENNAKLTQVIHNENDFNSISVNGGYNLFINSSETLSLSSVINFGRDAEKIIFGDSVLFFDSLTPLTRSGDAPDIELSGNVIIKVNSFHDIVNRPIFSNVSGDGTVLFYPENLDSMYVIQSYKEDGSVYARLIRETDYSKIFNTKMGNFINFLRTENSDDKLLNALDSASSRTELNRIIDESVKTNPLKLMTPIRIFNYFVGFSDYADDNVINFIPFSIFNDDFHSLGGKIALDLSVSDKVSVGISGYAADMNFSDKLNDFRALLYGGNLMINYNDKIWVADLIAGMTLASLDTGFVFSDGAIEYNPKGSSYYFVTNIGKIFNVLENVRLIPFINLGTDSVYVLNQKDTDFVAGVGAEIKFISNDFDIKYDYGLRFRMLTSGQVLASFRVNFVSPFDRVGGNAEIAAIYDEMGLSYNLRLGATIEF